MSVWTVIAHYGDAAATTRTVSAILAGDLIPDRVLIVDNQGDLAGSAPTGSGWADAVEIVTPGHNAGFAGAAALGTRRALAAGADWVWFVNNDARPERDCLSRLVAAGSGVRLAGLITPAIAYADGDGLWYAGGDVDRRSLDVRHWAQPLAGEAHDVGFATGCALLARAAFIKDCGAMDEDLFMYYEDVDWSLRATTGGWRILLVPGALVVHDVARRDGRRQFSAPAVYYMTRNRMLVARRFCGSRLRPAVFATWWALKQLLKSRSAAAAAKTALAAAAGLSHGAAGRKGPMPAALGRRLL